MRTHQPRGEHGCTRFTPLVQQVLDRWSRLLRLQFGDRLLETRLFGSFARGEANEDSDLDVFVLLDQASSADRNRVLELAGDLWRESELRVSPVVLGHEEYAALQRQGRPLIKSIDQEGLRL